MKSRTVLELTAVPHVLYLYHMNPNTLRCYLGHTLDNVSGVTDEEVIVRHILSNDMKTREAVMDEYFGDRKIGAIKVLRDQVKRVAGFAPGLKTSKDVVESIFATWDASPLTRSTGAQSRIDEAAANERATRIKNAVWDAAHINITASEARRVADALRIV